jgi:hypothetical protein
MNEPDYVRIVRTLETGRDMVRTLLKSRFSIQQERFYFEQWLECADKALSGVEGKARQLLGSKNGESLQ